MTALTGVLPVDKPAGPTSHDVVALARRSLHTRRIGHTGTLDPFASGLLLLCLGSATRLAEYLTPLPKTYRATLRLGVATDTDDHTGAVVSGSEGWRELGDEALRASFAAQVGPLRQTPPTFSAKRVAGERAYQAARRGVALELAPVEVTVFRLEVLRTALPEVEFEVECSSGTYIRSIARDVGAALGVGAHLTALRRTRVGGIPVDAALGVDEMADEAAVARRLVAPLDALVHLPRLVVDADAVMRLAQGRSVPAPAGVPGGVPLAIATPDGTLAAIGERDEDEIRPRKVFV